MSILFYHRKKKKERNNEIIQFNDLLYRVKQFAL